jgi:hypothetical protein
MRSPALAPSKAQQAAEVESDATSGNNEVESDASSDAVSEVRGRTTSAMGTTRLKFLLKKASKAVKRAKQAAKKKGGTPKADASKSDTWVAMLLMLFLFLVFAITRLDGATAAGREVLVAPNASVAHGAESIALPQCARWTGSESSARANKLRGPGNFFAA